MSKGRRIREEREEEAAREGQIASADYSRKLDRAERHAKEVADRVERWLDSDAYSIVEEADAETGDHVLRAKITEPLDEDLPLLIGDAVHNLRSALDHIAYRLAADGYEAAHPGGSLPENHQRRIMFPVVAVSNDPGRSVDEFYAQVVKGQLRYVPDAARLIIEGLQPYKRVPGEPLTDALWVINDLDVIDKHRKLHTAAAALPLSAFQITGDFIIQGLRVHNGGPVENGAEVMRWRIDGAGPQPVHLHGQFTRKVCLAEGPEVAKTTDIVALLNGCVSHIREGVIPALKAFL